MKKILVSKLLLIFCSTILFAQTSSWSVDKAHTQIKFTVTHMVIASVDGNFKDYEANLETKSDGTPTKITASIKTASIFTDNEKRDEHLRSDDFFNSEKYPEMTFVSKKIEKVGKDKFKITGDLTIRDITKSVVLDTKFNGKVKDPWGNTRTGWIAKTKINRFDFDLKWNKAIETGGLIVGKEVEITINIEFVSKG